MYVRRMRLWGVKSFHIDLPEGGEALPEPTRHRLLLQGIDGIGKTTILESVRLLWEAFGGWIDHGVGWFERMRRAATDATTQALLGAELAAMELGDFPAPGRRTWIGMGQVGLWDDLKRLHPDAAFAGLTWQGPNALSLRLELPSEDWQALRHRSMAGVELRPNVVHFPADVLTTAATPELGPRLIDTTSLNWAATYSPDLDLASLLLTLKTLRPTDYDETRRMLGYVVGRRNKRLVGFGDDGQLSIEGQTDSGITFRHPPEHLSSGERRAVLMTAFTGCFLRPGGILLLDDSELHLDSSLIGLTLAVVGKIVEARRGQWIAVSNSEWVEEAFPRDAEKINLTPWRRSVQ